MAIIDKLEVTVTSGGAALQEYDVHSDDQIDPGGKRKSRRNDSRNDRVSAARNKKVFKYVEAVPGTNFEIRYSARGKHGLKQQDFLSFGTYINGQRFAAPAFTYESLSGHAKHTQMREGTPSGNGSELKVQPWCWTELSTSKSV